MEEKTVLEKEYRFFQSKKRELLESHRGKFVLIKGEELIDIFSTFVDAYKEGVRRYGNQPFFVKEVEEEDIETLPALTLGIIHAHI